MKSLKSAVLLSLLLFIAFACSREDGRRSIEPPNSRPQYQRKQVAILIFDGVQIIDYTGPFEVFGSNGFRVFTIAESRDTITTSHRMKVIPSYTFEDHPKPDIIVIPGGNVPHSPGSRDPRVKWMKEQYNDSLRYLSVCNGSFLLAATGLLDGKDATTTAGMIDHLGHFARKSNIVFDRRFTQSGNIFTSGGFMAGIDGALAVVEDMDGHAAAQSLANNLEYNWQPESGYARAKMADLAISQYLDVNPPLFDRDILEYEGDESSWKAVYKIRRNESLQEFSDQLRDVANMYDWEPSLQKRENERDECIYLFEDGLNRKWKLQSIVESENIAGEMKLSLNISRI